MMDLEKHINQTCLRLNGLIYFFIWLLFISLVHWYNDSFVLFSAITFSLINSPTSTNKALN